MHSSWFYSTLNLVFLLALICTNSSSSSTPAPTVSYSDHCSSFVPESSPTSLISRESVDHLSKHSPLGNAALNFMTSYFTGGNNLLGSKEQNQTDYTPEKFLILRIRPYYYKTITDGIYKVDAVLKIRSPYQYSYTHTNSSFAGSYYHRGSRARGSIRFLLTGFWSEISRKLCVVGSASRAVDGIRTVNLDAVLKLNYASENPDIYTGLVSGTLESTCPVNDPCYFDLIFIFSFPELSNYSYSLVSQKPSGGSFPGDDSVFMNNHSSDTDSIKLCSMFFSVLEMQYGKTSPLGVYSAFLALNPFQCSGPKNMLRFLANLQNISYFSHNIGVESTLIGEASWDNKNNELSGVACRLLNPVTHSGHAVGDCTMGFSLKYNTVWTIRNEPKVVGQFWSTKSAEGSGYFGKVNLTSFDPLASPDLRYKYTELGRAKKFCPIKKPVKKGSAYPLAHSYDMRFDLYVEDPKGKEIAWGYAKPISVGSGLFDRNTMVDTTAPESATGLTSTLSYENIAPTNISYRISIEASKAEFLYLFPNLNPSMYSRLRLGITAEGAYSAENGYLCMVACGQFASYGENMSMNHTSMDCEILVRFQFASLNDQKYGRIKGTIESTREKSDPLHFKDLKFSSAAYYPEVAESSIWRMDFEITMVLISNTLLCIFTALQILHVKRNPEILSRISLVMLLVLCVGSMIPLVLNFEAMFLGNHKQTVSLSSGGWIEANEVAVRVITLVAFLLQIRLAQLVWNAKQDEQTGKGSWAIETKSIFVTLALYILGSLLAVLWNWTRNRFYQIYSLWGGLRSYAGLILDGFLFPQIVLNIFGGSSGKALGEPFYLGTSMVRLVPHAYNQYRVHNYPTYDVNGTYYYANPGGDLYSTTWDVLIPCGIMGLAMVIFLQQRNGGRWILPRRFRELELYERVPTSNNE